MSDKDEILNNRQGQDPRAKISLDAHTLRPGDDQLMNYLSGELSPEEQRDIELWLSDEGMESDAVEGLKMMDTGETRHSVHRINHQLRKTLHGKKERRKTPQTNQTTLIAICIILLLAIVALIVIKCIQ